MSSGRSVEAEILARLGRGNPGATGTEDLARAAFHQGASSVAPDKAVTADKKTNPERRAKFIKQFLINCDNGP